MRLIVEARWGAEDLAVCVHELVLVSSDVHGVHCPLQQVQTLVAGGLQAVLGRQVGPQGAGQAGVVAQVATLGHTKKEKKEKRERNFIDPTVEKLTQLQQQKKMCRKINNYIKICNRKIKSNLFTLKYPI